jgi:hypothetical protein
MLKIIPKGNGFFENYDTVFGKKSVVSPEEMKLDPPSVEKVKEKKESLKKCNCEEKFISKKEFDDFKLRLFNILLLERGMVLNVARLMSQLAIADEQMDKIERDPETLQIDIDMSQQNITNQFEDFDRFNEIIKEQLGIKEATDGDTSKDRVH